MSKNPEIHVFTKKMLEEHIRPIAAKVHELTVADVVDKLKTMNSGQILNSSRHHGRELCWSPEQLDNALKFINDESNKGL